ncbi:MAG TPA: hypothetical protein VIJ59_01830 [Caulobacteraceae bacterium]
MTRLALAFFTAAACCALIGMMWGIHMGMTETFTLAPAHAHLNLVGWATLALMGAFYAAAGDRASTRLGWLNFALSTAGVVVFVPSLAILLATTGKGNLGLIVGPFLALAGMATFLVVVIGVWRKPARA